MRKALVKISMSYAINLFISYKGLYLKPWIEVHISNKKFNIEFPHHFQYGVPFTNTSSFTRKTKANLAFKSGVP